MKKLKWFVLINLLLVCVWLANRRTEKQVDYDINITMESTIPEKLSDEIQSAVALLPEVVVRSFAEEDWKFILLQGFEDVEGYEHIACDSGVAGLINFSDKAITIRCGAPFENAVRDIALHELCHYADRLWKNESNSDEFKALYGEYKDGKYITYAYAGVPITEKYKTDILYATTSPAEFFAETMKDYLLHPDYLKENYPKLYEYHLSLQKKY